MASEEIRVLVVDDSAVIRSLLTDSIGGAPGMKVVGVAEDGQQALDMLDAVQPDVITLDIQMPRMDGLATLDAILARRPIPVIMVSSLTQRGARVTIEALASGASDYVTKPSGQPGRQEAARVLSHELIPKIHALAGRQRAQAPASVLIPPVPRILPAAPPVFPLATAPLPTAGKPGMDICVKVPLPLLSQMLVILSAS